MSKKPVVLAVTSDHHSGSTVALCPPEGVRLDDQGYYKPSKPQLWLWDNWLDFWTKVRDAKAKAKASLVTVFNGDCVDGDHHGTGQIASKNPNAQDYIANKVFAVPMSLKPDHAYMVRGTEAHAGSSGSSEEALAEHIGCERDPNTQLWSHWHLRLRIHGLLVDFQHHGRMGQRPWTQNNVVNLLAAHIWMEHTKAREEPPAIAFRSDRHVFGDSFGGFPVRVIQTPAWQLKTAFAHKVAPESISTIGGIIATIYPDGTYVVKPVLYQAALPTALEVA